MGVARQEQRRPQGAMRRHEQGRVLDLLCQGQELFTQCMRPLELGAIEMIIPQTTQHSEKLVRIFEVLTQCRARE